MDRLRRLRNNSGIRNLVRETDLSVRNLVYPIFVEEGGSDYTPISSMPGISRIPEKYIDREMEEIARLGIGAVMLFGVSRHKDAIGTDALSADGLLSRMARRAKSAAPEILVIADICFCEYTDHGHCGVLNNGCVDNDATLISLGRQAVIAAEAGADIVAPSAMMDGQVAAIRSALDRAGWLQTPIMSYSSKFASAFYGPFRIAASCGLKGHRMTYQMDFANGREALRESLIDEREGADILMVKPALAYLDVISSVRRETLLPVSAYQVSGEYAMIKFAAEAGALDERRIVRETLTSIKRAGADIILTYFAKEVAREGL